jgi:hypothetical protein
MRLLNSSVGLDDTTYGFEHGFNLNFQHGRMGAVLAAVSGYDVWSAENNVLAILGTRGLSQR